MEGCRVLYSFNGGGDNFWILWHTVHHFGLSYDWTLYLTGCYSLFLRTWRESFIFSISKLNYYRKQRMGKKEEKITRLRLILKI
jgi:hypothetical protein